MKKRYMSSLMAIVAATALSANVAIAHEGGVAGEGLERQAAGHAQQRQRQGGEQRKTKSEKVSWNLGPALISITATLADFWLSECTSVN